MEDADLKQLKPSPEQLAALPENVIQYILKLEEELKSRNLGLQDTTDRLRKANWSKWNRSR